MTNESSTLADYLRILRRRKWLILAACVLVPALAVILTHQTAATYKAEANVALDQGNLVDQLNGTVPSFSTDQQAQLLSREAEVARSAAVQQRALPRVRQFLGGAALDDVVKVEVAAGTGVLVFRAERPSPRAAARVADGYAAAYLDYRRSLNEAQYQSAITRLEGNLAALRDRGDQQGALYQSLQDQLDRVQAQQALVSSGALVLGASEPKRVDPSPVRNAVLGLALGLVLGLMLAFLADVLDRRTERIEQLDEALGLRLLAEIPDARARERANGLFIMANAPLTATADGYRSLRAAVDLALVSASTPTLMVTSAREGEGKTTTACNLAAAFALSGTVVTLVDLDFRRPAAHRLLGVSGAPGVAEIAVRSVAIADALEPVDVSAGGNGVVAEELELSPDGPLLEQAGALRFLPAGTAPANVGDFLGTLDVPRLLEALAGTSELVIIDAPPLLGGGDGLLLSSHVDGVLIVTRLGVSDRRWLVDVRRRLALSRSNPIGYVVTAADRDLDHARGAYGSDTGRRRRGRVPVR